MVLPEDETGCRRYVARLVETEISALAFGLGPVHEEVPTALVAACKEAGLVLLVVPAATGFLTISSAYWAARSRSTERQLNDAVTAQRALVDAAAAVDPVASILQRLARTLDGWVALLDAAGEIELTYPTSFRDDAADLRDEVARLEVAGVHSSASFTIADPTPTSPPVNPSTPPPSPTKHWPSPAAPGPTAPNTRSTHSATDSASSTTSRSEVYQGSWTGPLD